MRCTRRVRASAPPDRKRDVGVHHVGDEGVYSHDGPIRRNTRGYILTTDQSDAGRAGIFSRHTNRTQAARVYSHDGPIERRTRRCPRGMPRGRMGHADVAISGGSGGARASSRAWES
eukprot:1869740-Pyramimonas_sp.AAC.1